MEWLYKGDASAFLNPDWHPSEEDIEVQHAMVEAYIFGDRFQALEFKAEVLRCFGWALELNICGEPFFETINYAFAHLPQNDALLERLVELHCRDCKCEGVAAEMEERDFDKLPRDFLVRVAKRYSSFKHQD